jgi:hypothetical protein
MGTGSSMGWRIERRIERTSVPTPRNASVAAQTAPMIRFLQLPGALLPWALLLGAWLLGDEGNGLVVDTGTAMAALEGAAGEEVESEEVVAS